MPTGALQREGPLIRTRTDPDPMPRFHNRAAVSILSALLLSAAADGARAQCTGCAVPRAQGEGLSIAGNALIGGATAAVRARLNGRPVLKAFAGGAAGGVLTYAGKRISVERMEGAGFLGREVAAVGTSFTANAAEGRGLVDRLMLPAGPVRVYVQTRGPGPRLSARVDAAAVAAAAYAATVPGSRFDADASLSAGALVFRVAGSESQVGYDGRHAAGVVLVRDGEDPARVGRAAAHERVHVLQYDQTFLLWAAPVEARLMARSGWTRALHRWVDLGLNAPVMAGVGVVVPYRAQPWEAEAVYMARAPLNADDQ